MASTYRIAERASESLYEDEALRSNLTDTQAEIVLKWATEWITERANIATDEATAHQIVATESVRVRDAIKALNSLGKGKVAPTLGKSVASIEPILSGGHPFSREEVLGLVTELLGSAWKMRSQ